MRFTHATLLALGVTSSVMAQPAPDSPLDAATQPRSDQPLTATTAAPDADILQFSKLLGGTFASAATAKRPQLILRAAPITVEGLANCFLVELCRADAPADPFRQYIAQPYRRVGALRLRVFELPGGNTLKDALASLPLAPSSLPSLKADILTPTLDMPLDASSAGGVSVFSARTDHPAPVNRAGATELSSTLSLSPASLAIAESGLNAEGKVLWGSLDTPDTFTRSETKPLVTTEDTLVFITTVPATPAAPKLAPGGQIIIHYTSWLASGQLIESSRTTGKQPAAVNIPGALLPGLNRGLISIAAGERRKIVIPPALGYGLEGRGAIPPNATLIFDVECLHVDNTAQAPSPTEPAPSRMFSPHGPIGAPPTNGTPESPRGSH